MISTLSAQTVQTNRTMNRYLNEGSGRSHVMSSESSVSRSPSLTSRFGRVVKIGGKIGNALEDLLDKKLTANPNDYELQCAIGNNHNDRPTVWQALHIPTNTVVAIKRVDLEECDDLPVVQRECILSASFQHDIIRQPLVSFTTGSELWLVMKIMRAGSAWRIMQYGDRAGLEEHCIAYILGEMLKGLVYLHQQGYVYNGLRASSILLDTDGAVQLASQSDIQTMFKQGHRTASIHHYTASAHTVPWLAPEVLDQDLYGYDQKVDIYSVGITALELANGHAPYTNMPPTKVFLLKMNGTITLEDYLGPHPRRMSKGFRTLVNLCLNRDPRLRPTAAKLLSHSFFRKHTRNLSALLNVIEALPRLDSQLPSRAQ
eukprot:Ihof_evm1s903 gene=Ihof_evmTU1s903